MLPEDLGELPRGRIGALQRLIREAVRLVHILSQADDAQGTGTISSIPCSSTRATFKRIEFVPQSMPATVTEAISVFPPSTVVCRVPRTPVIQPYTGTRRG